MRTHRAKSVVGWLKRTFDVKRRDRLLDAVRSHCRLDDDGAIIIDGERVTDEDLAIGLYVVTLNSFAVHAVHQRQFSCPIKCFMAMFETLEPQTKRSGRRPNKIVAVKRNLEGAGLIECVNRGYVVGGAAKGVGQKFVVGSKHWRRDEFEAFRTRIGEHRELRRAA